MIKYQQTLNQSVYYSGIGLHSGKPIKMAIHPLPENSGIIFKRLDTAEGFTIEANVSNLGDLRFSTTLTKNGVVIQTIEHLMAAFGGVGVDNALIELDGAEVPAMDGSAFPFVDLIMKGGLSKQAIPRTYLRIKQPIQHCIGDRYMVAIPANATRITCSINYDHPLLKSQKAVFDFTRQGFIQKIAPARTFGFLKDAEIMWENGLAMGTSLENSVILTADSILNDCLRFKDEFVRHKILDIIGDLSLFKFPFLGQIIVRKGGHQLHSQFIQKMLQCRDRWDIVAPGDQQATDLCPLPTSFYPKAAFSAT